MDATLDHVRPLPAPGAQELSPITGGTPLVLRLELVIENPLPHLKNYESWRLGSSRKSHRSLRNTNRTQRLAYRRKSFKCRTKAGKAVAEVVDGDAVNVSFSG